MRHLPTGGSGDDLGPDLPDEAWLVALATLPRVGPARLAALLDSHSPEDAWGAVQRADSHVCTAARGRDLAAQWQRAARAVDVHELWARYRDAGVGVVGRHSAGYPEPLLADPEPPAVLFTMGDLAALAPIRVAVVGTRLCTRYGVDLATELGELLAAHGVTVVSGLAAGIDAAAHAGALRAGGAPPVGVVGTSMDNPYPTENARLWERVAEVGFICGESPLAAPIERWRFPARNRIIAGLSQLTVVVESHERGGSLYTAAQAVDRGRPVFAVPGSIRSPASTGCNRLLGDGCLPLCDLDDILVAVGLLKSALPEPAGVEVSDAHAELLELMGWSPTTLDALLAQAGADFDEVAMAVEALTEAGLVATRGRWIERTSKRVQRAGPNDSTVPPSGGSCP